MPRWTSRPNHEAHSPPLYYMLLHVWMAVFGNSEVALHALSLVIVLATVPVAFLLLDRIGGRRAAWAAAGLAAMNPFLTYYAQEARMYALMAFFSLVVAGAVVLAFAPRAVAKSNNKATDRRYVALLATALLGALYTHNWAIFIGCGSVVAVAFLIFRAAPADRRRVVTDAVVAYIGVGVLYAPWVPTLVFQARETGAPWSVAPKPSQLIDSFYVVLGGTGAAAAVAIALAVAGYRLAQRNGLVGSTNGGSAAASGTRTDLFKGPERPFDVFVALALVAAFTLLSAWVFSQISPAWALRYLAVLVGPMLAFVALGIARAGRVGLLVLLIVLLFWITPRTGALESKSNVREVAQESAPYLKAGDTVFVTHPEQVPVLHYYLPSGLKYVTPLGNVADPTVMDWRGAMKKLETAPVFSREAQLVNSIAPGSRLMLVQPVIRTASWGGRWTREVRLLTKAWGNVIRLDPELHKVVRIPKPSYTRVPRGVRSTIYDKR